MVLVQSDNYILVVDLKMKSMVIIDEIFDMVKIPRNNFLSRSRNGVTSKIKITTMG